MPERVCEPGGLGLLAWSLGYALAGIGLGIVGGRLALLVDNGRRGWRLWAAGLAWVVLVHHWLGLQFLRLVYRQCEMAAWGMLPGGAMALLFGIYPAGLMAMLIVIRSGARK